MSKLTWRLVITSPLDGAHNMAIDQAIMEAVAEERVPPTLRFYAWDPPCLSLGYTQPVADVDQDRLAAHGWGLVRRLTGGRAILHSDELTYSVALTADDPIVAGDIVQSYRRLSRPLLHGLRQLGAEPQADKRAGSTTNSQNPICFEVPSHYEITLNEKKLFGSAQVRKFGAVLQHGSLPLTGDITRIGNALVFSNDNERESARTRIDQRATTLESALGRVYTWEQAVEAMISGFQEAFDLDLITGDLTAEEQARTETLRAERYLTADWNARF